jgi:hypothetical protein
MELFLEHSSLQQPALSDDDDDDAIEEILHVVLLKPNESNPQKVCSDPLGWGLELVCWENEDSLRVGRVFPDSEAARGGLLCGDIVDSINGANLDSSSTDSFLAWAMLALDPLSMDTPRSWVDAVKSVVVKQRASMHGMGPLVLRIRRRVDCPPIEVAGDVQSSTQVSAFRDSAVAGKNLAKLLKRVNTALEESDGGNNAPCGSAGGFSPGGTSSAAGGVPTAAATSSSADDSSLATDETLWLIEASGPLQADDSRMANIGIPPVYQTARALYPGEQRHHFRDILHLIVAIRGTFWANPFTIACRSHLYLSGLPETVITLLETSTILEAIHRGHPMLGVRMMSPRYQVQVVYQQLEALRKADLTHIPRLANATWERLVEMDYSRVRSEPVDGPIRFVDEEKFVYRMPSTKFPLDRILETIFLEQSKRAHQAAMRDPNGDLQRIRGGGAPPNEEEIEPIFLSSLEKSMWLNTLVYGYCVTTRKGDSRKCMDIANEEIPHLMN